MSGCRSSGCSAVVCIGSSGAVTAVAPSGAKTGGGVAPSGAKTGGAVAPSGAKGSSEREPVTPPFGDQPPGEAHSALPAPVDDQAVNLGDVGVRECTGRRPRGDGRPTQDARPERVGQPQQVGDRQPVDRSGSGSGEGVDRVGIAAELL